jgi:hydrogenase maturation protease
MLMATQRCNLLIYGYGNPGRGDDGLGPALAAALEEAKETGATIDSNYQLTVEDAADLAERDVVIFADADVKGPEPFWFGRVAPTPHLGIGSHDVTPGALVALTDTLFGKKVDAYALGIRGYDFGEFADGLSPRAQSNLEEAVAFLRRAMHEQNFEQYSRLYGIDSSRHDRQTGAAQTKAGS